MGTTTSAITTTTTSTTAATTTPTRSTTVPIHHNRAVHDVETTHGPRTLAKSITLLELVDAVSESAKDEAELVAVVTHMLATGAVRLRGNFRNEPVVRLAEG